MTSNCAFRRRMLRSIASKTFKRAKTTTIRAMSSSAPVTFTKTILKAGNGPTPKKNQQVTVAADLYLADANGGKGTGIWSTHKDSGRIRIGLGMHGGPMPMQIAGFLFSAKPGKPEPFTYEAGVGGVVRGWEDGVASMQLGETAVLQLPWLYACEFERGEGNLAVRLLSIHSRGLHLIPLLLLCNFSHALQTAHLAIPASRYRRRPTSSLRSLCWTSSEDARDYSIRQIKYPIIVRSQTNGLKHNIHTSK